MKKKTLAWIYVFGFVLLGISFLADMPVINNIDSVKNPALDFVFEAVRHIGSVFLVFVIMTSLFMWEEKKREWIPALWAGLLAAIALAIMLKFAIMRARPFEPHFWPLIGLKSYAFPSLHTAVAFSALPVLEKEYPRVKWAWLGFAALVGLSRVYLGAHFPSDVVFGAMLGFACGSMFVHLEETKKVFRKWKFWK